jgi:hypothetical protein
MSPKLAFVKYQTKIIPKCLKLIMQCNSFDLNFPDFCSIALAQASNNTTELLPLSMSTACCQRVNVVS